ncbi:hypothetical protein EDC01DRAFT_659889 [Geopyxis carbonaria]|nr:hypothetical protein EDC01DRAFT_659889 [Geopyxis carbonaria]
MDEQQNINPIQELTTDGQNPNYSQTGLQTQISNHSSEAPRGRSENRDLPEKSTESHSKSHSPTGSQNSVHREQQKPGERQVTDPVTHLPVTLHDNTSTELERIPPPPADPQEQPDDESLRIKDNEQRHADMQTLVDEETKKTWVDKEETERRAAVQAATVTAVATAFGTCMGMTWAMGIAKKNGIAFGWIDMFVGMAGCGVLGIAVAGIVYMMMLPRHMEDTNRQEEVQQKTTSPKASSSKQKHKPPESAAWLNSFLSSLWPIVNPTLFVSLADMLEDVMQSSLPKFIRGVRVADLGQGTESLRILGIRWLEAGDAHVSRDGQDGEEGDFVNLELACAYRSRPVSSAGSSGLKKRSRNAHLLIEFWTVGGLRLPVWVEVTGILATARLRLQLTPNPPFLSEMIMTLLGQPKVTIKATPITKNFLNVMDLPFVSHWLQSNIDQAVAQYIAPRSLNLDLKSLLMGSEKLDTEAFGIVLVRVIKSQGFKDGDGGKAWMLSSKKQRGDPYVTVGWGKWGKALWSTRILENEGEPVWDETTVLLVGHVELNAQERLRLQLWDSDRSTADDLLGTVEIPIQDVISSTDTRNRISAREDRLCGTEGEPWPGTLSWEVGYFQKTKLDDYLSGQDELQETKTKIEEEAENKLREAKGRDETGEIDQQKKEDFKEKSNEIIASKPPREEWPSGILSVQIQQINGLEIEHVRQSGVKDTVEDEEGDDLPSSYCTIILNHQKVFKTRTKLKSNKPFFDAGTERFIRDWRTTTAIISVRDSREHESDPLLGIVVLPLSQLFKHRSQITASYPLVGGIGHGRIRLKLLFRSVKVSLPRELIGWDLGTLEVLPGGASSSDLPSDLTSCRLVFRTLYGKGKMLPRSSEPGHWDRKNSRPLRLAVQKRYGSCISIKFRKRLVGPDTTPAFATFWLKDIPDDEEITVNVPVLRIHDADFDRAVKDTVVPQGEPTGSLQLRLRFHPGLSGYHQSLASKDPDMADVMAVLDAAEDSKESEFDNFSDYSGSSSSSDSDSDSSVDTKDDGRKDNEKCGIKDELKDYKKNRHEMHRRHRGLMQWKGVRNLAWIKNEIEEKGEGLGQKVKRRWKHQAPKGDGGKVETEV